MNNDLVYVFINMDNEDLLVGQLWFYIRHGRESASFAYHAHWLKHPKRFALAPTLPLTSGTYHTETGRSLFGALADSAPDRWGRMLMRRNMLLTTQEQKRNAITLFEKDYLLGINDQARIGALRFASSVNNPIFLASQQQSAIPPLVDLPKLLHASERIENNHEDANQLRQLLAPGSSLGGARPKASIRDHNRQLAIAKFPSKNDEWNTILWEAVALTLAKKAGINVPTWRLEKILNQPVLIIDRFDRNNDQRIPFLSAMSMLNAHDHEMHSYLEIAYALSQFGAAPNEDMHELWRRLVFNIMIANTDDHLRNHGFLYEPYNGWRLSPVYDLNPTPIDVKPRILTTAINFEDNVASLETAKTVCSEFRLTTKQAHKIIDEVQSSVRTWQTIARQLGLSSKECQRMASAFVYC